MTLGRSHWSLSRQCLSRLLTITAPMLVLSSAWASDDSIKQIAPRTELYQIQTLTISDQQFLKGDSAGATPVTIAGQLRIAQGTGRLPVVVLQHASSGYDARIDFAAYVPFYPDCMTTFRSDTEVVDRPIRIFGGAPDDYNPIAVCKPYVARLQAAGKDVVLTEYANAPHSFDNPLGAQPPKVQPTFESVRNCRIQEEDNGVLINLDTDQPFTYKDACVFHGPHTGYDPEAAKAAREDVNAFFKSLFKL